MKFYEKFMDEYDCNYYFECDYKNYYIKGRYNDVGNEDIKKLFKSIEEVIDELDNGFTKDLKPVQSWYKNVTELYKDYFVQSEFNSYYFKEKPIKKLNSVIVGKLSNIFKMTDYVTIKTVAEVLSVLTGEGWEVYTMRGCNQSDYADVITNDKDVLDGLTSAFFGTGTTFYCEEDGCYYPIYIDCPTTEECKEELHAMTGYSIEKMELYIINGYTTTPNYEKAV